MKIPPKLRPLARFARSFLMPIRSMLAHYLSLVHKTGKELNFQPEIIQQLEAHTEATLLEMGIQK